MKRLLLSAILAAMGIASSMLFAAEPAAQTASSTSTAPTKDAKATPPAAQAAKGDAAKVEAAKPDAKAASAAAVDGEEKAPHATAADKGPSPQRFTPSEQVRADFDVSFPVDI